MLFKSIFKRKRETKHIDTPLRTQEEISPVEANYKSALTLLNIVAGHLVMQAGIRDAKAYIEKCHSREAERLPQKQKHSNPPQDAER